MNTREQKIASLEDLQLTALAERFRGGDGEAFGALYGRLRRVAFAVALRIVGCEAEAEDIAQDTFLKAWGARERLQEPASVRGWIARIAANLARTRQARRSRLIEGAAELAVMTSPAQAHEALERAEDRSRLRGAVARLTPRQCAVITLRIDRELSFKEIAASLGCSDGAARVNFTYGLRGLKEALAA